MVLVEVAGRNAREQLLRGRSASIAKNQDGSSDIPACVRHDRILHRNAAIYVSTGPHPAILYRMICLCPYQRTMSPAPATEILVLASRVSSSCDGRDRLSSLNNTSLIVELVA